MYDYERGGWVPRDGPPGPRRSRGLGRWLLIGGLALAFMLTLGVGAFLGSTVFGTAQAASLAPGGSNGNAVQYAAQLPLASTPGASGQPTGQCDALTVSSVSGQTIVAKAANGSTVTIHTTSSTRYTKDGQAASASAVTVGAQIHVQGSTNSDGSITATSIDVR
jgi:Domain of unknown function (DUF5666)